MLPASLFPRLLIHRPAWDVVTLTCVAMVVVQGVLSGMGGFPEALPVYGLFGLGREGMGDGQCWQLFTHALLHGSWTHLWMNVLVIYSIGGRVQHILGQRAFAQLFWGGTLVAALMHLLLHPALPMGVGELRDAPLVGASGGAMALLLALTSLSPSSRMWPVPVSGKNLGRGLLLGSAVLFLITPGLGIPGLSDVGDWLVAHRAGGIFRVGHIYHFGGAVWGWFYAKRLLRDPVTLEQLKRERERREGLAA